MFDDQNSYQCWLSVGDWFDRAIDPKTKLGNFSLFATTYPQASHNHFHSYQLFPNKH